MPDSTHQHDQDVQPFDEKKAYAEQEDVFVSRNQIELSPVELNELQV